MTPSKPFSAADIYEAVKSGAQLLADYKSGRLSSEDTRAKLKADRERLIKARVEAETADIRSQLDDALRENKRLSQRLTSDEDRAKIEKDTNDKVTALHRKSIRDTKKRRQRALDSAPTFFEKRNKRYRSHFVHMEKVIKSRGCSQLAAARSAIVAIQKDSDFDERIKPESLARLFRRYKTDPARPR